MEIINLGNIVVNTWLYPIREGYVLIDTGYERGYSSFLKKLKLNNIELKDIKYIFLTHAHDDHAGFINQLLEDSPDTRVIMSYRALERLYLGQNSFEGGCTSLLALLFCNFMKLLGKGDHLFPPLKKKFETNCILVTEKNKRKVEYLLEGEIIFTPGHTKDSLSLLISDNELFCGDAAMNGFPSKHKITIWCENKEEFISSWNDIIKLRPIRIYPGHGKVFHYRELLRNMKYAEKMKLYKLKQEK